jgi:hypothetical protein
MPPHLEWDGRPSLTVIFRYQGTYTASDIERRRKMVLVSTCLGESFEALPRQATLAVCLSLRGGRWHFPHMNTTSVTIGITR